MLILVFSFDVGKYCNEKKRVSDLLVAEKIMGFLEYSFSPPIWLLEKSILGKHFFLLGHRMGPEVPRPNGARGAQRGRVRAPEKNPFSKRAGSGPWVLACESGPGMEKPGPNSTRCHSYFPQTAPN